MPPHQLHPDSAGLPAPPVSAAGTEPRPHWARALPAPRHGLCPQPRVLASLPCPSSARPSGSRTGQLRSAHGPRGIHPVGPPRPLPTLPPHWRRTRPRPRSSVRPGRPGSGPQPVGRGGAETRQWGASRPAVLDTRRALAPTSKKHRYRCLAPRIVTPKVTGSELFLPQKRAVFERFCNRV